MGTFQEAQFPKPRFHIIMLFIDEEESVRRQFLRGKRTLEHNAEVEASGVGHIREVGKLTWMKKLHIVVTRLLKNPPTTRLLHYEMFFIIIL